MSKTIVVVGFGPGVSTGVAKKFGEEGFSIALIGRNADRLRAGVESLEAKGIAAAAFAADAGDPVALRAALKKVQAQFGPITVVHWNAFCDGEAGDLLAAQPSEVLGIFDIAIVGLLSAVQESLSDLKSTKGAVLVTNGALGETTAQVDQYASIQNYMGVALANAAKDKLVGLLAQRLKGDGIYVGQVTIAGSIKDTPWESSSSMDASVVADKFWELYQTRIEIRARLPSS